MLQTMINMTHDLRVVMDDILGTNEINGSGVRNDRFECIMDNRYE